MKRRCATGRAIAGWRSWRKRQRVPGRVREGSLPRMKCWRGRIAGLIHSAGVVDFSSPAFVRKSEAELRAVLEPKVQAVQNLLKQLQGEALKCVVLYSSVSGAVPQLGAGQADYAMGNAHMD